MTKREKFQNLLNSLPEINIQDKIQNSADTSLLAIQQYETVTALIYPSGDKECVIGKVQYRQIAEEQDVWCIIDGKRDQLGHDFSNGKLIMVHQRNQLLVIFQSSGAKNFTCRYGMNLKLKTVGRMYIAKKFLQNH
ncbi:unnamed protein product [Rhizophagus irregularis]|nr:unnamed protein product [Rhizophagus irregularis]